MEQLQTLGFTSVLSWLEFIDGADTHTHSCDGVQMMSAISSSILYHHTA